MSQKALYLLLIFLLASPAKVCAHINVRTGNFSDAWLDGQIGPDFGSFQIRRVYNSKSIWPGLMGYGWCSSLESTLQITPQTLNLIICDNQQIPFEISKNKQFFNNVQYGKINKIHEAYSWATPEGTIQIYDHKGRFMALTVGEHVYTFVRNEKGLVEKIQNKNSGQILNIKYNEDLTRITKVLLLDKPIEYFYEQDRLKSVKNFWGNQYFYNYDQSGNLTQIIYPDKTMDEMSYEESFGNIVKFKPRRGCSERLFYARRASSLETKIERNCNGAKTEKSLVSNKADDDSLGKGSKRNFFVNRYVYDKKGKMVTISNEKFFVKNDNQERIKSARLKESKDELVIKYVSESRKIASIGFKDHPRIEIVYHSDGNVMKYISKLSQKNQDKIWDLYSQLIQSLNPAGSDESN